MEPAIILETFSMLPDEILCHILSFLPTQEAVATSVLSKKWRHLWTSVPVLDYDDQSYLRNGKHSSCFKMLVYSTILARDKQPIRKFRLKYDASDCGRSDADVNAWLKAVIRPGFENLDIDMHVSRPIPSLSCWIFRCTTLVALNLTWLSLNVSSVELPSLKSLHLLFVEFARHQNLLDLLCGCPILEDFKARYIFYAHEGSFCVKSLPKLVKLVSADLQSLSVEHPDIPLKAICNVKFLSIRKFKFVKVVPEFPNLINVFLNLVSWDLVFEMLKNCPKLEVFEVSLWGSHADHKGFSADPHLVPECLTSQFRRCSLQYFHGTGDLQFAQYIMQNSTTIKTMTVYIESSFSSPQAKKKMRKELASCPRRSALCELSFE